MADEQEPGASTQVAEVPVTITNPAQVTVDDYFAIGGPLDAQVIRSPGSQIKHVHGALTGDAWNPCESTETLYKRTLLGRGKVTYRVLLTADGYCAADLDRCLAAGCVMVRGD